MKSLDSLKNDLVIFASMNKSKIGLYQEFLRVSSFLSDPKELSDLQSVYTRLKDQNGN